MIVVRFMCVHKAVDFVTYGYLCFVFLQKGIVINCDSLVDLRYLRLIQSMPLNIDQTRAVQRSLDLQQIAVYVHPLLERFTRQNFYVMSRYTIQANLN